MQVGSGGTARETRPDKSPNLPAGIPLHGGSRRSTLELNKGEVLKVNLAGPSLHSATTVTSTESRPSTPGGGQNVTLPGVVNINTNSMVTVTSAAATSQSTSSGVGKPTNGVGSHSTTPALDPRSLPSSGSTATSILHPSHVSPFQGRSASDVAETSVSREEDRMAMAMLDTTTEGDNASAHSSPVTIKEQAMLLLSPTSGSSSSSGSGGPDALTVHHPTSSHAHEVPLNLSPRRPSMNVFTRQPLSISTSSRGSGNGSERQQQGGGATPLRGDLPSSSTPNGLTTNSNFLLATDRQALSTSPMRGKVEFNNAR